MAKSFKSLRGEPTFKVKAPVAIPGGEADEVELTCIYKDRKGLDELLEADKALTAVYDKKKTKSIEDAVELECKSLMLIVSGWEFSEPFNKIGRAHV